MIYKRISIHIEAQIGGEGCEEASSIEELHGRLLHRGEAVPQAAGEPCKVVDDSDAQEGQHEKVDGLRVEWNLFNELSFCVIAYRHIPQNRAQLEEYLKLTVSVGS